MTFAAKRATRQRQTMACVRPYHRVAPPPMAARAIVRQRQAEMEAVRTESMADEAKKRGTTTCEQRDQAKSFPHCRTIAAVQKCETKEEHMPQVFLAMRLWPTHRECQRIRFRSGARAWPTVEWPLS